MAKLSQRFLAFKDNFSYRHYVALQCFTALVFSYLLRFCLSIALVEMSTLQNNNSTEDNSTCPISAESTELKYELKEFNWTERQKGLINTAFFCGYITTQIPGGILADKWDASKVVTLGMFITSGLTVATPFVVRALEWGGLIFLRIIIGVAQGLVYAATHTLLGKWIPPQERGAWVTFVFSGVHIGSALNVGVGGIILSSIEDGWPITFYLYGVLGLIWMISFNFTVYGSPETHLNLSFREKQLFGIDENKNKPVKKPKIPWKRILANGPFWGCCFGMFGHDCLIFTLVTQLPAFMNNILHFNICQNGLLSSSLYILIFVVSLISGHIVDYVNNRKWISLTLSRKIGATIASVGPSVGLVVSVYVGCSAEIAAACFIVGGAFMGFFYSSLKLNPLDLTKNYIGTISGMVTTAGTLAGIKPYIIARVTPDQTLTEWRIVMWIAFAITSVTNIIYCFTASAHIQKFDHVDEGILISPSIVETAQPPSVPSSSKPSDSE